jgi:Ser/Thr protein kinase RdoA (MazF antagonist)
MDVWVEMLAFGHALRDYVVPPTTEFDAGPHVESDRFVTLWAYVEGAESDPEETGSSLRALHHAASAYQGKLRSFDPRGDALIIADLIGGKVVAVLRRAAERIELPELAEQPIHGDANFSNVIAGGRWLDLDDVCIGPPEWDLACLRHMNRFFGKRGSETYSALTAYGLYDESAVAALEPLVVLWISAWGALAPVTGAGIGQRTQQRLNWLEDHYGAKV